ncbi:MAG: methyltransferase domain-containing protein [Chloroflexi bacterium]|nr:methyltransferase domain-containing protein [Chloroflexota bacterium]
MNQVLSGILACPNCQSALCDDGVSSLRCTVCKAEFPVVDGIPVLLPSDMDSHKHAEDVVWQKDNREGEDKPAWMALVHKRDDIFYFLDRIAPHMSLCGKVLEIGAGSCWAGGLMKGRFPDAYVVCSDVSPAALRKGRQVCGILGSMPDAFVACDAEKLPFMAGSFDVVFGNACLHHLSAVSGGVRSIGRVLKPGGMYYGSGELASGRLLGAIWTSRLGFAGKREKAEGVNERVYGVGEWREAFRRNGFTDIYIGVEKDWQYRLYHWFPPVYYLIVGRLPSFVLGRVPCGIKIAAKMGPLDVEAADRPPRKW